VPLTYYMEDIESIDGVAVKGPAPQEPPPAETKTAGDVTKSIQEIPEAQEAASGNSASSSMVIVSSNREYLDHITGGNKLSREGDYAKAIEEFPRQYR